MFDGLDALEQHFAHWEEDWWDAQGCEDRDDDKKGADDDDAL